MRRSVRTIGHLLFGILLTAAAHGAPVAAARPLVVGLFPEPPFAFRDAGGTWTGFGVELWRAAAGELQREQQLREGTEAELVRALAEGQVDVIAAPLAMAASRERLLDYTHPVVASSLGIAVVPRTQAGRLMAALRTLATSDILGLALLVPILLVLAAVAIWLFERRRNRDHFGGQTHEGVGSGLWWAAVTFHGVGYGDKVPVTVPGRVLAVGWMIVSLVTVASITAVITARLTVAHFEQIRTIGNLATHPVAVVVGSGADAALHARGITPIEVATVEEGCAALASGRVEALVHPVVGLRWAQRSGFQRRIEVLPDRLDIQLRAFAVREGSELREPLNRVLLDLLAGPVGADLRRRWLADGS